VHNAREQRLERSKGISMATNEEQGGTRETPERLPVGELRLDDRGEDEVREALEESIGLGEPRPLTREEREAAKADHGVAKPVYAPASERVAKPPLPGDEKLINQNESSE